MVPGDMYNPYHRTKSTGLRLRKVRIGRLESILRRMLAGISVDGAPAVKKKSSNPNLTDQARPDNLEDSETTISSTNLLAESSPPPASASSSSSSSPSSPEPHDQHIDDDKTAAGKSIVDDDVCVGGSTSSAAEHGLISLIGRRREMEDAVTAVPALGTAATTGHGFFGVYDGHGGFAVAEKCQERLHHLVAEELAEDVGGGISGVVDWEKVMRMSFARMDREVCDIEEGEDVAGKTTGSTAVVAVVGAEEIVVANCGDSRAVLCRGGVAMPLSRDHKPERPDERERVEAAGGSVVDWHGSRVLGVLATSRSIGDQCMRPFVISAPEVTVCQRTRSDEFLILASDGLWDVVPNGMACELVKMRFLHEQCRGRRKAVSEETICVEGYATHAASMLAELAIARGSRDNVSVILVKLTR